MCYSKAKNKGVTPLAMVHIRPVALRDLNALAFIEAAGFPAAEAAGKDNLRERLRVVAVRFDTRSSVSKTIYSVSLL